VFSHDPHHKATWDGKLGIWAFTEKYTAQRNNRNRKKGVVCVRNLPTIDRTVYKRYLLLSTCFPPSRKSGRGMTAAASFESSKIVSSPTFPSSTLPSWLLGLKVVGTSASPFNRPTRPTQACATWICLRLCSRCSTASTCAVSKTSFVRSTRRTTRCRTTRWTTYFGRYRTACCAFFNTMAATSTSSITWARAHLRKAGMLPMTLSCDSVSYDRALSLLFDTKRSSALLFNLSSS